MIRSASEMRAAARASLSGKWGGAVMVTLVYLAVMGVLPAGIDLKVYDGVGSIIGADASWLEYVCAVPRQFA